MAGFAQRMIGAAMLDVATYEEVEADRGAMGQAMTVVVLSSLAAGIGAVGQAGVMGLVVAMLAALIGWFIWAGITYVVGTKMLPEPGTSADLGQLLRTIGFSQSPGLLRILGVVPVLGAVVNIVVGIWMLIAMVIAVRQALDYTSTGRAVGVCLIGFVVYLIIAVAVAVVLGAMGATAHALAS